MKSATKTLGRPVVEIVAGPHLLELRLAHDGHPIRERERLDLVVGHVDRRASEVPVDPLQVEQHPELEVGVDMTHHLVEDERGGLANEGAAQAHPLLLSSGERPRGLVQDVLKTQHRGHLPHPDLALGPESPITSRGNARFSATVKFGYSA